MLFGGIVVLEHARSGEKMKGLVSFHGGLTTMILCKILIVHGTADAAFSMDDVAPLAEE